MVRSRSPSLGHGGSRRRCHCGLIAKPSQTPSSVWTTYERIWYLVRVYVRLGLASLGVLDDQVYDCRGDTVESSPIRSLRSKVEVFRIAVFSKAGPVTLPDVWGFGYSYDDEGTNDRVSKRLLMR